MNLDESHFKIFDFMWVIVAGLGGIIWRMLQEKVKAVKREGEAALSALKTETDAKIASLKRDEQEAARRLNEEIVRQRQIGSKLFDELRDVRKESNETRVTDLKWLIEHGFQVKNSSKE